LSISSSFVSSVTAKTHRKRLVVAVSHFGFVRGLPDLQSFYEHSRLSCALDLFTLIFKRVARETSLQRVIVLYIQQISFIAQRVYFY